MEISNKKFFKILFPFVVSTLTQPILSATDIAVMGSLSNKSYISSVAIGSLIFNTIYWVFGFLRVASTTYSAQDTKDDLKRSSEIFFRMIFIAVFVATFFLIFKDIIFKGFIYYLKPGRMIQNYIYLYYKILIYGAPFVFFNYVILGWLMGKERIKNALLMQIGGNILNIVLDIYFVKVLKLDIKGVAFATLISQLFSFLFGVTCVLNYKYHQNFNFKQILNIVKIKEILIFNKNLMLRTILLLFHNNLIMYSSVKMGETILATNTIFFQIINIMSYYFDGIANAASVFSGKAIGEKNEKMLKKTIEKSMMFGAFSVVIITTVYFIFFLEIFSIFTKIEEIIKIAEKYKFVVGLYPVCSFVGLILYGVFTGSSRTNEILKSTLKAFILFFIVWKMIPRLGEIGIWISVLTFYFFRGIFLVTKLKVKEKK